MLTAQITMTHAKCLIRFMIRFLHQILGVRFTHHPVDLRRLQVLTQRLYLDVVVWSERVEKSGG
ncbi:MAG: hypothetical protein OHK0023_20360 [Anaerolineae bacterium]